MAYLIGVCSPCLKIKKYHENGSKPLGTNDGKHILLCFGLRICIRLVTELEKYTVS